MPTRHETLGSRLAGKLAEPASRETLEDAQQRNWLIERLIRLRKEDNLSQAEVARRMRTTQSSVSEFEKATVDPRLSTLQKYVRAVGSRVDFQIRRGLLLQFDTWLHRSIDYAPRSELLRSNPDPTMAAAICEVANRVPDRVTTPRSAYGIRVSTRDARVAPQLMTDVSREGYVRSLAKVAE